MVANRHTRKEAAANGDEAETPGGTNPLELPYLALERHETPPRTFGPLIRGRLYIIFEKLSLLQFRARKVRESFAGHEHEKPDEYKWCCMEFEDSFRLFNLRHGLFLGGSPAPGEPDGFYLCDDWRLATKLEMKHPTSDRSAPRRIRISVDDRVAELCLVGSPPELQTSYGNGSDFYCVDLDMDVMGPGS